MNVLAEEYTVFKMIYSYVKYFEWLESRRAWQKFIVVYDKINNIILNFLYKIIR